MWEWLQNAARTMVQRGKRYMHFRTIILSLFTMPPQQAQSVLHQKLEELDEEELQFFSETVAGMIFEAQQAVQQTAYGESWGGSSEDRIAQLQAHIMAGSPTSQASTQAQMYLQGLNMIASIVAQFTWQRRARAAQGHLR
jgi:hypothetical protein